MQLKGRDRRRSDSGRFQPPRQIASYRSISTRDQTFDFGGSPGNEVLFRKKFACGGQSHSAHSERLESLPTLATEYRAPPSQGIIGFMTDVAQPVSRIEDGDPNATELLVPIVYAELRRLAEARMSLEKSDHSLQPTALVHEAYLRLVGPNGESNWRNRSHFFGAAAEAMRRILIDRARSKQSRKRGGDRQRAPLDEPQCRDGQIECELPR